MDTVRKEKQAVNKSPFWINRVPQSQYAGLYFTVVEIHAFLVCMLILISPSCRLSTEEWI